MIKFKLQSILSLRENIEKVKQRDLADAFNYEDQCKARKNDIILQQDILSKTMTEKISGNVQASQIKHYNDYSKLLEMQLEEAERALEKAHEEVLAKQQSLVEAMKDRKIFESLKETHIQEQLTLEKHAEQVLLDEVVSFKYSTEGEEE
ncbi:flagellar export protein FliJ [Candidatus Epulonipiscium fishelsonii]|uniref:Flagellar export protein FliJ n=1 Tax=Candidatus Epulonipiscium fishelsonii TaxID=77094 RepID=A0ACC8XDP9_9FIRM|nr:flagellar export protein FliJ [Epulopiscium sp. SCG-B05WGA-EpuloA1]ONI40980.1 flagellar export protein FliJ [Epulopiscium sp. SCG-B11WGA-EpuloA1]ONI47332.1 flagellar export protein FliJ [Epulopiscium sp. SCG-C06WGA-EpuloA1]